MRFAVVALALVASGCLAQTDPLARPTAKRLDSFVCAESAPCLVEARVAPPGTQGVRVVVRSAIGGAWAAARGEDAIAWSTSDAMAPGVNAWAFTAQTAPETDATWTFSVSPMSGSAGRVELARFEWLPAGCRPVPTPFERGLSMGDVVERARAFANETGAPAQGPPEVERRWRDDAMDPTTPVTCPGRDAETARDAWSVLWPGGAPVYVDAITGDIIGAAARSSA